MSFTVGDTLFAGRKEIPNKNVAFFAFSTTHLVHSTP